MVNNIIGTSLSLANLQIFCGPRKHSISCSKVSHVNHEWKSFYSWAYYVCKHEYLEITTVALYKSRTSSQSSSNSFEITLPGMKSVTLTKVLLGGVGGWQSERKCIYHIYLSWMTFHEIQECSQGKNTYEYNVSLSNGQHTNISGNLLQNRPRSKYWP